MSRKAKKRDFGLNQEEKNPIEHTALLSDLTTLSEKDTKTFLNILDSNDEPNSALKRAAERHRKMLK